MSAIQVFEKNGWAIRSVEISGEPWFVGRDVASALGYTNPQKAVRDHCKTSRSVGVNNSFTRLDAQTVIINEPDLYRLIVKSNLPEAQKFEAWVFEEVLPTLRKTGSFGKEKPKSRAGLNGKQMDVLLSTFKAGAMSDRQLRAMFGVPEFDDASAPIISIRPQPGLPDRQPERVETVLRGLMPESDKGRRNVFGVARHAMDAEESRRVVDQKNLKLSFEVVAE